MGSGTGKDARRTEETEERAADREKKPKGFEKTQEEREGEEKEERE
jgi:hypothetical protein